jgi:hypothetical protein
MKKIILVAVCLLFMPLVSAFQNFLDVHGYWLEDNEFSWIGLQKLYGSFISGYDREASASSYLDIDFDPDRDTYKLVDDIYLPVEYTFTDEIGIKFSQLWVSWSAVDSRRPDFMFDGQIIGGFNNPLAKPTSVSIKRGSKYGDMKYTWECFEVPFNLKYAAPATYNLTILVKATKAFKLRLDAIYLGDGTNEPQNKNQPLRSGITVDNPEKVLAWTVPVTENFDRTLVAPLDKLIDKVNLVATKSSRMPFALAITGGLDLGTATVNIDFPLKNGSETLKTEISVVSFLKKRWTREGSVGTKTEVAQYLKPGNQAVISMGKTEFFWIDTIIPDNAKPGVYSSEIRIRTDNSSDKQIKLSVEVLDLKLNKPENFMIFHESQHYTLAKAGKLDMEQAWNRYKTDFADIIDHGIRKICLPLICIPKPEYVVDSTTFGKLVKTAKDAGFEEVVVDISKAWSDCLKDGNDGTQEFAQSLEKTTDILKNFGYKPVYFIGSKLDELGSSQFNLIDLMAKLPTKVESMATFKKLETFDPVDRQMYDLGDFDWKYVASESPLMVWEPKPHWGQHGYAKALSGVFNFMRNPKTLAVCTYSSVYGNEFDDFDQQLGDGSYTPGDLTMVYRTQAYEPMPSLMWECFRLGLQDWGMLEFLTTDKQKTSNFTDQIPQMLSGRRTSSFCSPKWQQDFWNRAVEYAKWMLGGKAVEPMVKSRVITFTLGTKTYGVDGQDRQMTVEPTIIAGKTYIPARYLIEPLGGDVTWEQATKKIGASVLNHSISLQVGSKKAVKDGQDIDMSDSPVIVSNRTLIPLRAASTLLGANVDWNTQKRMATITIEMQRIY